MSETAVAPLVQKYFEEHEGEDIRPIDVQNYVQEKRRARGDLGMNERQSAGAVRSCINTGKSRNWIEELPRVPGRTLTYRYRRPGTPPSISRPSGPASTPTPASGTTPPPPPRPRKTRTYKRPSGEDYYARQVGDFSDVDVLRRARDERKPVLISGPPGGGKTALIEAAFGDELFTLPGDADTGVGDITGDFTRIPDDKDDDEAWEDGPAVLAATANNGQGSVLFVDDATLIAPGVMSVLYPAMDGRGFLRAKGRPKALGKIVPVGPRFYVVAAHNPGVPGAILSEALSSRFVIQLQVNTDYTLAKNLGVDKKVVTVAANLDTNRRNGETGWSPQMRELIAYRENRRIFNEDFALAALLSQAPEGEDRNVLSQRLTASLGRRMPDPLSLGEQI